MAGRVIYKSRPVATVWVAYAGALLLVAAVLLFSGADLALAVPVVLVPALVAAVAVVLVGRQLARSQVAELLLAGDRLEVAMLSLRGPGERLTIPVAETSDWARGTFGRYPVIVFRHRERAFQIPLLGAQFLDREALDALIAGRLPEAMR